MTHPAKPRAAHGSLKAAVANLQSGGSLCALGLVPAHSITVTARLMGISLRRTVHRPRPGITRYILTLAP